MILKINIIISYFEDKLQRQHFMCCMFIYNKINKNSLIGRWIVDICFKDTLASWAVSLNPNFSLSYITYNKNYLDAKPNIVQNHLQVIFITLGQEKTQVQLSRASKFCSWESKSRSSVAQWASEISFSSLGRMDENFSLINDNFQSEAYNFKT